MLSHLFLFSYRDTRFHKGGRYSIVFAIPSPSPTVILTGTSLTRIDSLPNAKKTKSAVDTTTRSSVVVLDLAWVNNSPSSSFVFYWLN